MNATKSFRLIIVLSLLSVFLTSPLNVQAQDITGTISGFVLDMDGNPIEGVGVLISSDSYFDGVCSDNMGQYEFNELPTDSYYLSASTNSFYCSQTTEEANYAQQFWPNSPFSDSASLIELTSVNPEASDIDFTLAPGGTISGVVYETDESILTNGRVSIALVLVDPLFPKGTPTEIYTCTNQFTAEYELKHIPLGYEYKVAANVFPCPNNADGFASINAWPNSPTNSGGTILTPTVSSPNLAGIDFYLPQLGDTPTGSNVLTFTLNGFISFDSVSTAGTTTVEPIPSDPPSAPPNFQIVGEFYDVSTSATFTSAQVCFNYDDTGLDSAEESAIRLLHKESLVWVDVTDNGYPNTNDNIVCGIVANFSPFVVARKSYNFSGFFQPVDNLPTLNLVNAGSAIPVKFSLGGDQGLNILDAGYPKSQVISCDSAASMDGIEETSAAGSSGLSYDFGKNQYIYIWKTDKTWANTCRQLIVKLNDGTLYIANFKFK